MLTMAQMQSLLAPPKDGKAPISNSLVRVGNSLEHAQVKSSQFGNFEGRQGTKRRSSKGRVSTMPNGSRYYNDVDAQSPSEVVAYKV